MRTYSLDRKEIELTEQEVRPLELLRTSQETCKFCDVAISELSPQARSTLEKESEHNLSWFCSLGFAESYCLPAADRVCFFERSSGEIGERCFYRETMWCGLVAKLEVLSPINQESDLIRALKLSRNANVVQLHWLDESRLSSSKQTWFHQKMERTREDCWLALPGSTAEYLQSLGTKTRKHLPYYVRRLEREWGAAWRFEPKHGAGISRQFYDRLLDLNRIRMADKGRKSGWTTTLQDHRWKLALECGLLCCLIYRDQVVAGTFSFIHGNEAYLIVIAHDPQFNNLNLGNIGLWLTINHLIESGCTRFHLLWGQSFYKEQFGGKESPLYKVTLFDSAFIAAAWHLTDWILFPMRMAGKIRNRLFGYWPKRPKWVQGVS